MTELSDYKRMIEDPMIRRWNERAQKMQAEIERLRAAFDVLKELHALLDFEEPLTDEKPWLFEDASDINAAFVKAYAVIQADRAHQQSEEHSK